jgi:hypothetical protein
MANPINSLEVVLRNFQRMTQDSPKSLLVANIPLFVVIQTKHPIFAAFLSLHMVAWSHIGSQKQPALCDSQMDLGEGREPRGSGCLWRKGFQGPSP